MEAEGPTLRTEAGDQGQVVEFWVPAYHRQSIGADRAQAHPDLQQFSLADRRDEFPRLGQDLFDPTQRRDNRKAAVGLASRPDDDPVVRI